MRRQLHWLIDDNNNPDYAYMDQYMRMMERKEVLLYMKYLEAKGRI
jgi:hypothetical protein